MIMSMTRTLTAMALTCTLILLGSCKSGSDAYRGQPRIFPTADRAANALLDACQRNDLDALAEVLGSEHREVYVTSDPASDREARQRFVALAAEKQYFVETEPTRRELVVGNDEWPLPIPLVRVAGGWRFDTAAGAEEIINRRIGRNELEAIELCRGVLHAQEEYRATDWDGDGAYEYASQLKATPGQTDGLFWPAGTALGPSPLEGFLLDNQDYADMREEGEPWRGYRGKALTAQGSNAPGGAQPFLSDGDLSTGWAMILCPAVYGNSGIMSFMVSHHGTVYEKDLGPDGLQIGKAMEAFDPDPSWTPVH
jgi:hypothetical protein